MAGIIRFEDIEAWKIARQLCKDIYFLSLKSSLNKDFSLKDQINKSSGSIMDNIAEGFERGGNKEFIQFLSYAKGSCGETRSQLYRCFDKGYITSSQHDKLLEDCLLISNKIGALIKYLKHSNYKGHKYK